LNKLHLIDNSVGMRSISDESVDVILTDPPYLYLKNQKFDQEFDEELFFNEAKRVLKKNGFIILFGRGTAFYRWNTILDNLGFTFKEEIVWDKSYCTSPLMRISRVHETVSIFCKGKAGINKVKIPYLEMKGHDIDSIIQDIKRMRSILKNSKSLKAVQDYLENNVLTMDGVSISKGITRNKKLKIADRSAYVISNINDGLTEKSIIRTDYETDNVLSTTISSIVKVQNRNVAVMNAIEQGMNEKTIIKEIRDHYSAIHPTQKPVRLLERLLALVLPKDVEMPVVLDPFAGSASTLIAGINMGCDVIGFEIDKEYFNSGNQRFEALNKNLQKNQVNNHHDYNSI
nr:site-specific DNA-methyltransferase [Paludibacter sp.]